MTLLQMVNAHGSVHSLRGCIVASVFDEEVSIVAQYGCVVGCGRYRLPILDFGIVQPAFALEQVGVVTCTTHGW